MGPNISPAYSTISFWEADSPSNVEDIDLSPAAACVTENDIIGKAVEIEPNIVVVDEKRSIEVHLLSDIPRGRC